MAIKPSATERTAGERLQKRDVRAGAETAPREVLALAVKAGRQWLEYRFDGKAPSGGVIARSVWDGVPPAAPDERMKGKALTTDLHAFSAHSEEDGWVVSVSSRDPRMAVMVITIDGPVSSPQVAEISG